MKTIETNNYSEPSISTIELKLEGNLLQKASGADWPEQEL